MLEHDDIWHAIDTLAARHGFSPSGLAREAGLDATTFNLSKRIAGEDKGNGKKRWPSTESIAKILGVTGTSFMEFAALAARTDYTNRIPVITLAAAARGGAFDADGKPAMAAKGRPWAMRTIAGAEDVGAFGVVLGGEAPTAHFRPGQLLIAYPAARIKKGDRTVTVTADGALSLRDVIRVTGKTYELSAPLDGSDRRGNKRDGPLTTTVGALRMLAKIVQAVE